MPFFKKQKFFPEIILKSKYLKLPFFIIAMSKACNFGLSQIFNSKC